MQYDGPAQMAVYDRLGPMARKVAQESPRDVNLPEIVRAFEIERRRHTMRTHNWERPPPEPPAIETPEGDAALAAYIAAHIARLPRPAYG